MIGAVVEKELRLTFLTLKFAVCSGLLALLMAASTAILVVDWHKRLDLFRAGAQQAQSEIREASAYAGISLQMERRPQLLSLLHQGIGDRFGRAVILSGRYDVPRLAGGSAESSLSQGFLSVDFAHIVAVVLSLVALVFSYDLVNGDRAQGTLQLTLSTSLPRHQLLLGKYLGGLLSVLVPFAVAALIWLLVVMAAIPQEEVDGPALARVGLVALLSILYGSLFVWLGLFVSALTHRPSTALIIALLVWTLAVVVYPPTAMQVVGILRPVEAPVPEPATRADFLRSEDLRARVDAARWEALRRAHEQYRLAQSFMRLSPFAAYDFAAAALAGTDLDRFMDHLQASRRLDESLRAWQREKARLYPHRELGQMDIPVPLDLSDLPAAVEAREPLGRTLRRILPDFVLLVVFNLVFMLAAQAAFQRYDVRL